MERVRGRTPAARSPRPEPGAASLYQTVPFRQDTSYLAIGERTNANGSKKFREAMLEGRWDDCVEMARDQIREGAHMLDLCVDYVGRDGVADMEELAGRFATASTLPIVLDSTEVDVLRAGLEKLGGRAVINSVNYEDGDGPESRFAKVTRLAREHGAALIALTIDEEGQARTAETKVAIAERLIDDLTGNWGIHESDILIDMPDLHHLHRPGGVPQGRHRHHRGDPRAEAAPPGRADHAGPVQHLLRPQPGRPHRAQLGLPRRVRQGRPGLGDRARLQDPADRPARRGAGRQVALDLIYDRRAEGYDPLQKLMELFEGVDTKSMKAGKAEELLALPLDERLQRRIIDGEKNGLEADLDEALTERARPWTSSTRRCWTA